RGGWDFRQRTSLEGRLQFGEQPIVFPFVKLDIRLGERALLRAGEFAGDQVVDERQPRLGIQSEQVCLDLAGAQQVNAGQQHSVDVQQRLDAPRPLLV